MRILFVGDVVGRPGREAVRSLLPVLSSEFSLDAVIVNGENSAGGLGATSKTLSALTDMGVAAITLGNHTWRKKELVGTIGDLSNVVRPANFPVGNPGQGHVVIDTGVGRLGVVNLQGRVFMDPLDCPFATAERVVRGLRDSTDAILVDFHAEATSEKIAMGWFLDGSVSAVLGTHTHVQTSDERVLPEGTAYITDVGMTGPEDTVLGINRHLVIKQLRTRMPQKFEVPKSKAWLCGVVIEIDVRTGKARSIERINRPAEQGEAG
jgi:metallophosphoesterase (TIGR00282 family)